MVSDIVLVAIITGVPATISAIVGAITHSKLKEVGQQVDGRLDEMLEMARDGAFAAGEKQQKDREKAKDGG